MKKLKNIIIIIFIVLASIFIFLIGYGGFISEYSRYIANEINFGYMLGNVGLLWIVLLIVLGCIFIIGYLFLNPSHDFQDIDEEFKRRNN